MVFRISQLMNYDRSQLQTVVRVEIGEIVHIHTLARGILSLFVSCFCWGHRSGTKGYRTPVSIMLL
jgi:hypothetical protein